MDRLEERVHKFGRIGLQEDVQLIQTGLPQLFFRLVLLHESHDVLGQGFGISLAAVVVQKGKMRSVRQVFSMGMRSGTYGRECSGSWQHGMEEEDTLQDGITHRGLRSPTSQLFRESGSSINILVGSKVYAMD